jgi:hypothetical protein
MYGSPALHDTVAPALMKLSPATHTLRVVAGSLAQLAVIASLQYRVYNCSRAGAPRSAIQQTSCLPSSLAGADTTPACGWDLVRQMTEHTPKPTTPN